MAYKNYSAYPFVGIPTFLRASIINEAEDLSDKKIAIGVIGAPFDEGCPYLPGSRLCARAIREQTHRFTGSGYYDHQTKKMYLRAELSRHRIYDFNFDRITRGVRHIVDQGALAIILGGDYSFSYQAVRAFDRYKDLNILHLDTHTDYLSIEPVFENTNPHPFRYIHEMEYVKA